MKKRNLSGVLAVGALMTAGLGSPPLVVAAETQTRSDEKVSPARDIRPRRPRGEREPDPDSESGVGIFREIDGSQNHPTETELNASETPLGRRLPSDYADGLSAMAGSERPSARAISNLVADQEVEVLNPFGTTDFLWQWGQFLDHDIDLTDGVDPAESEPIAVPVGDVWFDPNGEGGATIAFNRSIYATSGAADAPREQLNEITGWIDASNVYGSDDERAHALRTLDGTGRLRTGDNDLLPDDDTDLPNAAGGAQSVLFFAGDVRANEQVALVAMHTLFMREHNRVADQIRAREPDASGDLIYERARRYVGALMQGITYNEFLPALLGRDAMPRYDGYDPSVDARIANAFSTAAYRFGHSALSPQLLRLDANLEATAEGPLPLRDAFFSPDRVREEGGIEPILRGLSQQAHQRIDNEIIDDVRNFLFGFPGAGGFDLASLNLQRGRDHGLPSYAEARVAYGLSRARSFADVNPDPEVQARLAAAYADVESIDLWIGGLSEAATSGSQLGPLFTRMIADQFAALRDGDRFWYAWALPKDLEDEIRSTRLSDVIRRNTEIGTEIPDDVFRIGEDTRRSRGDRGSRSRRR